MTQVLQFAILGLGASAAYVLLGSGVVLINRGSSVINFAQAGFAMVGAFLLWDLHEVHAMSFVPAFIASLVIVGLLGVLTFFLVMRPLAASSTFARTLASLGVLLILQAGAGLIWGVVPVSVPAWLPTNILHFAGVTVSAQPLVELAIAIVIIVVLWVASERSRVGMGLRALAENPRTAAGFGWSPTRLGVLTWCSGAVLGALAGMLIAPTSGLDTTNMPLLIVPTLAAVYLGSFESFPILLLASIFIGVGQSLLTEYVHVTGVATGLPFIVIFVFLVVRRRDRSTRSQIRVRLPELGTGRANWFALTAALVAGGVILGLITNQNFLSAMAVTFSWALIVLSVVVLVGYTGQLSLAQASLAGIAALIAAHLVAGAHFPFILALIAAMLITVLIGGVLAIPALRTRDINLAIVTLGLAYLADQMIFSNLHFIGSYGSIDVGSPTIFGFNVAALFHPTRYALFALVVLVLASLVVSSVRRGTSGQRLLAVRNNERAAAALGVNVVQAKLFAFMLAAAVTSLGGVLLAFQQPNVTVSAGYGPLESIDAVAYGVIGGAGYVSGAAGGATLANGAFGNWLLNSIAPSASALWLEVIGGAVLILLLVVYPDGMAREWQRYANAVASRFKRRRDKSRGLASAEVGATVARDPQPIEPRALYIEGLTVQHGGGVIAVDDVSVTVAPGEVVALIGPNGAGKSSLIDGVSGLTPSRSGGVRLGDETITQTAAFRRSRMGLVRSFQSLELFETSTVRDNLAVGADEGRFWDYPRDLVLPRRPKLDDLALTVIDELGLGQLLDTRVDQLPYGQRRLVAVARAVAARPSVLMLDEPAAGMGGIEVRELARVVRLLSGTWGIGVLVVEHDMEFVMEVADRIVVLEAGRHLATGTPSEIRSNPDVIRAYLGDTGEGGSPVPAIANPSVVEAK
jgi:ABC-type branched-subunit amino acid transport system ATPase component/branched-subunit amino acid ABC-type transport system permease component